MGVATVDLWMSRLLDEALDLDETGRERWLATLPKCDPLS
jgi:hypothetical protein